MIKIENLDVSINKKTILKNINFDLSPGESIYIDAPNGAGKTVLIKTLCGLYKKQAGIITGIYAYHGNMCYLNQKNVYPDNVKVRDYFNLYSSFNNKIINKRYEKSLLNRYNLTKYLTCTFEKLSGGTIRKVLIVACLLCNPKLYILDEPFSGLDNDSANKLIEDLKLKLDDDKMIIFTSHNISGINKIINKKISLEVN